MIEPAHSDCSPSSLERRILCPGSRNAERGLPDRPSTYAAEGTVFHEVVALCLEFGLEPDNFLDRDFEVDGFTFTFDEEFARHARPALDRVRELMADCDPIFIEKRVDISAFTEPGQFGTLDVGGVNLKRRIIRLHDWKYGEGVGVEAVGNWQVVAYVLGLWDTYLWKLLGNSTDVTVEIVIDQPRRPQNAQQWTTTLDELFKMAPTITAAIAATNDPDAPRHAGIDQCFFCKARGRCAELARFNMEQAALKFEDMDARPREIRDLSGEEIARIIRNRPLWSVWMSGVHEFAVQSALQGEPPPGLKLVEGRGGHRLWTDEERAERMLKKLLGPRAYQRKLVSPAMAEKVLTMAQAEDLKPWWTQRQNKPSLVPTKDERTEIRAWHEAFENYEEKTDG